MTAVVTAAQLKVLRALQMNRGGCFVSHETDHLKGEVHHGAAAALVNPRRTPFDERLAELGPEGKVRLTRSGRRWLEEHDGTGAPSPQRPPFADLYGEHEFFPVRRADARKGDWYANHATITEVHHGPKRVKSGPWSDTKVERGETLLICGSSMTTKGASDTFVVVGRRRAPAAEMPIARTDGRS